MLKCFSGFGSKSSGDYNGEHTCKKYSAIALLDKAYSLTGVI